MHKILCTSSPVFSVTCKDSYKSGRVRRLTPPAGQLGGMCIIQVVQNRDSKGAALTAHSAVEDLGRYLIARTWRLSTSPLHDLIESFEIRQCLSIHKKPRRLEGRNLFSYRYGHELVDARSVLPAQPLNRIF